MLCDDCVMASTYRIECSEQAVQLRDCKNNICVWRFAMSDLREIVGWKDDLWSVDSVCCGFRLGADAHYLWCAEEDEGWKEMQRVLEERFGITHADWWDRVTFPAFETNWTSLWGEAHAGPYILLPRHTRPPGFPVEAG
jgi:hypothetical protein